MPKLNQIIAIEKGVKTQTFQDITEGYHALQRTSQLAGIARSYTPKDEEGEQLPPESTRVQVRAEEVIAQVSSTLTKLFDITATKDYANCHAKADVVVDGTVLLHDVPATYLLLSLVMRSYGFFGHSTRPATDYTPRHELSGSRFHYR